ncbi:benzoate 4-monooxygenase cytochrome P450 [Trichodelitschia bisporula]|uniref:Benzoate 4-monooxygenase cytochrome P450 n=1 Tax=Trichodelitschia bisporula TaxID=703511 RepID=A0A6G1I0Y8_9PEZI|nr:benzoate 4-monooxygenase cytochrome P450 [Trichodelitschia bisporula]
MAISNVIDGLVSLPTGQLVALMLFLGPALYLLKIVYNLTLHPLRSFPGPILARGTFWPMIKHTTDGTAQHWITALHQKYGNVVRISPGELSFAGGGAFKDIYGYRKGGQPAFVKSPKFYSVPAGDEFAHVPDIIRATPEDHSRIRRIFSNAFSDRALKQQEPLFLTYVDLLVQRLRNVAAAAKAGKADARVNMVTMYNFTTFDIMGDLTFGEPLNLLRDNEYHPWVANMFASFRFGAYLMAMRYVPYVEPLLVRCMPASIDEKRRQHGRFSSERVDRRLAKTDARPDIWGLVLAENKDGTGPTLPLKEMYTNANLFMIAGTETTATLLSGLTYHLLRNPPALARLVAEIRTAFPVEADISIERLQHLKYLHACIEEGLRMFPPVSNGLPRIVPVGGAAVDGVWVPGGAAVMVTHLAAYRNEGNFRNAGVFAPERWLSGEEGGGGAYAHDMRAALQPFSLGPRVCLGKNMAYHEIRIILSKVLWNFDLELCPESENWADQKIFIMWDKGPLWCRAIPVR